MGFFSNLFKSKEERARDEIFERINKLLNDDATQISAMLPIFGEKLNRKHIDMYPNATGEFGRCPENPIPCNGPLGEITYLSRLVVKTNASLTPITFHRIGTTENSITGHDIDIYEIIDYSGYIYESLYLDFYNTTKSRICPKGYVLQDECIGFRGINQFNADFQYNQYKMTQEYATKFLGVAIVDTDLKNMNYEQGQKMMKCIKKNHAKIKWW